MKLTIFTAALILGGTERISANLANELVKKGYEVEFLTLFHVDTPAYPLDSRIKIVELLHDAGRSGSRLYDIYKHIRRYFALIKYTRSSDTDKYLVMLPLPVLMLLSLKGVTFNVPVIFSERDDPKTTFATSRTKWFFSKILLNKADGAIFQTTDAEQTYREVIKRNRQIILNPVSEDLLSAATKKLFESEEAFLCVGRLTRQKNQKLLIEAFSLIHTKIPTYKLKFVGDGADLKMLQDLCSQRGIENKVVFTGKLSHYEQIYKKGDIFVLSSLHEGLPNALIEAMVMGLPCIASDCPCGGPRMLIDHGINGLLYPLNNVKQLAECMMHLATQPFIAEKIGEKAAGLKEKVAPEKIFCQWIDFIVKI